MLASFGWELDSFGWECGNWQELLETKCGQVGNQQQRTRHPWEHDGDGDWEEQARKRQVGIQQEPQVLLGLVLVELGL